MKRGTRMVEGRLKTMGTLKGERDTLMKKVRRGHTHQGSLKNGGSGKMG